MNENWRKGLRVVVILAIGIFTGIIGTWGGYHAVKATSGEAFCSSCHVMEPMAAAYRRDPHSGAGPLGVRAECSDCHLPHDNVVHYLYQKGVDGIRDVYVNVLGSPEAIDWHARRDEREHYVYDSGCLACHTRVADIESGDDTKSRMHAKYAAHRDDAEPIRCVSCHVSVGHKNMGHLIEEAFGPSDYGTW